MKEYYRTKAVINLDAICENIRNTRKLMSADTKLMAVIKTDGYGHGAIPIAMALDALVVDNKDAVNAYAVATVAEGIELRRAGVKKPILTLGVTPLAHYDKLLDWNITPTVFAWEMAKELSDRAVNKGVKAPVHIKLDTGMSRIGFAVNEQSADEIKKISELPGIVIEGCFTHFAKADESNLDFTKLQFEKYMQMINWLMERGITIPVKHVCNSAGIMEFPEGHLDMVRSGISTYGMYPSEEVHKEKLLLKPALSLKAYVTYVKDVEEGTGISYGGTYVAKKKIRVATIPIGYGDGYKRALSNKGRVLIHGMSAPILGRVCMDQFMVDVSHIPNVKENDEVTLIGRDGEEEITMEELGELSESFNYEIACSLGKRIPREYIYQGRKIGTWDSFDSAESSFSFNFPKK
ncbi:MAG: alanine racemase [Lachnospiraceae bacterium]|nr:alanine racemase [Lachnospiraceae bacterium]